MLQVAGGEVDAHSKGIVIPVGKSLWDATPKAADADDDFSLVVTPLREVRDEERAVAGQQRGVSLGEDNGGFCII